MPSALSNSKLRLACLVRLTAAAVMALALTACETGDSTDAALDQYLITQAQAAEQAHDTNTAIHHYGTLYQSKRDDMGLLEALARNLRYGGQYEQARRLLEEALARLGPNPRLLLEKGKDEIGLSRADLAVQTLELTIQAAPAEWEGPATLAIALDRLGRTDEAAVQYQAALTLNPGHADTLNNYGLSRALSGHLAEGLTLLRQAVARPGSGPRVRENLAFLESLLASSSPPPSRLPPPPGRPRIQRNRGLGP